MKEWLIIRLFSLMRLIDKNFVKALYFGFEELKNFEEEELKRIENNNKYNSIKMEYRSIQQNIECVEKFISILKRS